MKQSESRSIAVIYSAADLGGEAVSRAVVDGATEVHDTLAAMGHRASLVRIDEGVGPFVERLEALQPDAVFNLCEGYREWSGGESCIAGLAGEDASIGISSDNVARDEASALARLQQLFDQYRAPVLVEEFIDGREFTVALLDGEPLLVEEIDIRVEPRIVGFRAKWTAGSAEYAGTVPVFSPAINDEQRSELMTLARRVWEVIGLRDYARVDFRMAADGRIYVLEANPNPDLSAGSGYRRSLEVAQMSYRDFITRLLDNALRRQGRSVAGAQTG